MPPLSNLSPISLRYAPYPSPSPLRTQRSARTLTQAAPTATTPTRGYDATKATDSPNRTPPSASFTYRPRRNGRIISGRHEESFEEEVRRDLQWEKENSKGRLLVGLSVTRQLERERGRTTEEHARGVNVDLKADRRKSRLFVGRPRAGAFSGTARPAVLTGLCTQRFPDTDDILAIPSSDAHGLHLGFASGSSHGPGGPGGSTSRQIDGLPVSSSAMSVDLCFDSVGRGTARTPGCDAFMEAVRGLEELARRPPKGRMTPSSPLGSKQRQRQQQHQRQRNSIPDPRSGLAGITTTAKQAEGAATAKKSPFQEIVDDFSTRASAHISRIRSSGSESVHSRERPRPRPNPDPLAVPVPDADSGAILISRHTVRVLEGALQDLERIERDVRSVLGGTGGACGHGAGASIPAVARVREQDGDSMVVAVEAANRTQDSDDEVLGTRLTRMRSAHAQTASSSRVEGSDASAGEIASGATRSLKRRTSSTGAVPTRKNPTRTASIASFSRLFRSSSKRTKASSGGQAVDSASVEAEGSPFAVADDSKETSPKKDGAAEKWTRTLRSRLGRRVTSGGVGKTVGVKRGRK